MLNHDLPIFAVLPDLLQTLQSQSQVILQAEPGAGKSTQVPLALLNQDWLASQTIWMLEPRRLAVKTLAHYLAKQLGETVGQTIGYTIRNERKVSTQTRLEIITEGVLSRRLQADPELTQAGLVIFDEFHERSIHADLGLTLLLDVQQNLRPDLKFLIMSATLDANQLQNFLPQAQFLFCSGRSYPITTHYVHAPLVQVLLRAMQESTGHLLLFLPGQAEIRQAIKEAAPSVAQLDAMAVCLPLYGALSPDEQAKVFELTPYRKIIFATNIAETSLTIEGIGCVIDTGKMKALIYDANSGMTRLQTKWISQAAATQRAGRAGRVQAGQCYRLWTETQQNQLPLFEPPEITQVDLTSLRMEVAQWGVTHIDELQWLTPPPVPHWQAAEALLQNLRYLTQQAKLTASADQAMQWWVAPRLAHCLQKAQTLHAAALACDLVALLQENDILRQVRSANSADTADLRLRWEALNAYLQSPSLAKHHYPLNMASLKMVIQTRKQLRAQLKITDVAENCDALGRLLAFAYPDRIAKRNAQNATQYVMTNGKSATLMAHDALQTQPFLVVALLDGQQKSGRIYLAAALDEADIWHDHPVTEHTHYLFDAKQNKISAQSISQLGRLVLKTAPAKAPDSQALQACLLQAIEQTQLKLLPWQKKHQAWLQRVAWLAQFQPDFPKMDTAYLLANINDWLLPYLAGITSVSGLQSLNLQTMLNACLTYEQQQQLQQQAPESYLAPSGQSYPIDYSVHGAKVAIRLQELFGQTQSPKLANGQVALAFEILSPALRPLQISADLAHFWQNAYQQVAKEMRGRYPKHRWPENPMQEKPGHSLKTRAPK